MSFTPQFNVADLMKGVDVQIGRMEQFLINELDRVGLKFVAAARSKVSSDEYKAALASMSHAKGMRRAELGPESPSFQDQTGNLRSSIGYVIFKNGQPVRENFEGDASEGKTKGYEYAAAQSQSFEGFMLIVVAGMDYAVYVEGYGYDVITGSSLLADDDIKKVFSKLEAMK